MNNCERNDRDERCDRDEITGIWIVPKETLLGYIYDSSGNTTKISDQTVWVIDKYEKGYLEGKCYLSINGESTSISKMIGSITPYGNVLISFLTENGTTTGSGIFKNGEFVMQMNTFDGAGIEHWSYMRKVDINDYDYHYLPGLCISVPNFMRSFDK